MRINARYRTHLKAQNASFVILFLAVVFLLAWFSRQYSAEWDWSSSSRNTLSVASTQLLDTIDGTITITAYATENAQLRQGITELVGRYQRVKPGIALIFVNPEKEPDQTREQGIKLDGELLLALGTRSEHISTLNEETISNALQRLARDANHWVVFVEGHGERKPRGIANHDLQTFTNHLEQKGFKIQSINLAQTPAIPTNTKVLVVASPQSAYLPGEVALLQQFITDGGNLLWLLEPGPTLQNLEPVAEQLGIERFPGTVVDPTTQLFGLQDPRFALVSEYPPHAITRDFELITLFPQAVALDIIEKEGWRKDAFLTTVDRAWSETGPLKDQIEFTTGSDIPGPLNIGAALQRDVDSVAQGNVKEQRIVVIGDGDFLTNTYLGNSGNLDLGLHIFNWLSADDNLISIPALTRGDTKLELAQSSQYLIGFGFLIALPLLLAGAGISIWLRRRKQ